MKTIYRYYIYILSISPIAAFFLSKVSGIEYYNLMGFLAQLLFFMLIFEARSENIEIKIPKYIYPLILLAVYHIIWSFFNGEIEKRGFVMVFFNNFTLQTVFLLILIENISLDDKTIKNLITIIKVTIILAVVVSIIQAVINPKFLVENEMYKEIVKSETASQSRRPSIMGFLGPNEVGLSLIPLLSILFSWEMMNFNRDENNVILYVYPILGGIVCFLFNSRYVLVSYLFILLIFITYSRDKVLGLIKYIVGASLLAIITIFKMLPYLGYNLNNYIYNRLLSETATTRLSAFYYFGKYFPQNPIFGRGIHLTDEMVYLGGSSQIHVGYLAHLDQWGIIGSLLMFSFWGMLLKKLYNDAKKTGFYGALFAFLSFLVANLTLVHYSIFVYGIIISLIFNKYFLKVRNVV